MRFIVICVVGLLALSRWVEAGGEPGNPLVFSKDTVWEDRWTENGYVRDTVQILNRSSDTVTIRKVEIVRDPDLLPKYYLSFGVEPHKGAFYFDYGEEFYTPLTIQPGSHLFFISFFLDCRPPVLPPRKSLASMRSAKNVGDTIQVCIILLQSTFSDTVVVKGIQELCPNSSHVRPAVQSVKGLRSSGRDRNWRGLYDLRGVRLRKALSAIPKNEKSLR